jgi:hypothetical protein
LAGDAHWLPVYPRELSTYPATQFDDQVDSTSQFLDWNGGRTHQFRGHAVFELYRLLAEEAAGRGVSERMVKLSVPPGISTVYTMTGQTDPGDANSDHRGDRGGSSGLARQWLQEGARPRLPKGSLGMKSNRPKTWEGTHLGKILKNEDNPCFEDLSLLRP